MAWNYSVTQVKDFFNTKVKGDIKDIQKLLDKKKNENHRKFFEDILSICIKILKIDVAEDTDMGKFKELQVMYEQSIALVTKNKNFNIDDLKNSYKNILIVYRDMSKFLSK